MSTENKTNYLQSSYRKILITINNYSEKEGSENYVNLETLKNYIEKNFKSLDYYCFSYEVGIEENKTPHLHIYMYKESKIRTSTVLKKFIGCHIDERMKSHKENRDYIFKNDDWLAHTKEPEKIAERIKDMQYEPFLPPTEDFQKGTQGKRNELSKIDDLLKEGKTPSEIFDICGLSSERYDKIIKSAFYRLKCKQIGRSRDINIIWHLGDSGSGKSHEYEIDPRPDDSLYYIAGHQLQSSGVFDNYYGQEVLYVDELKPGMISFGKLLVLLDKYRTPLTCRYCDGFQLWKEVHITSVYTPEELYKKMISEADKQIDMIEQLHRINIIKYHFCSTLDNVYIPNPRGCGGEKKYYTYEIKYKDFVDKEKLMSDAFSYYNIKKQDEFIPDVFNISENKQLDLYDFLEDDSLPFREE